MATYQQCAAVGCNETKGVTYDKPLCYRCWQNFDSRRLFECQRCHRFDELVGELSNDDLCWDCVRGTELEVCAHGAVEHQDYYLYILKLDDGRFYVGQSNDLVLRLKEHQDGLTATTKGKRPRLVWFRRWPLGRRELLEEERQLKRWVQNYPRQARQMINEWQRLIRLVSFDD